MKLRLYIGERQSLVVQQFESMAKVVSMALGGKQEKPPVPRNRQELQRMMASVFG